MAVRTSISQTAAALTREGGASGTVEDRKLGEQDEKADVERAGQDSWAFLNAAGKSINSRWNE